MNSYKLVTPENFSEEHVAFIGRFKSLVLDILSDYNVIFGAKDINSRHIIATHSYAKIVGLKDGTQVTGMLDKEMPCYGTAVHSDKYIEEDKLILTGLDIDKSISILKVLDYADGLKVRLFKKYALCHKESLSILGVVYSGTDIELKEIIHILPSYILSSNKASELKVAHKCTTNIIDYLTEYEKELCFLFLLNWEFTQIAEFMNKIRPRYTNRTSSTIVKKKNYICAKLRIGSERLPNLQKYLLAIGFHRTMPLKFYSHLMGSYIID